MKIQLAYPYEGALPDAIVEVDAKIGRLLLREGRARGAPAEPVAPRATLIDLIEPLPKPAYKPRTVYHPTPDNPAEMEE